MSYLIETQQLSHGYSHGPVLSDLSLQVPPASIFGFLGPNGSGKTTTIRLLLGLMQRQQGTIRLFGKEISQARLAILSQVGALIESPAFYGHLTGRENLELIRRARQSAKSQLDQVLALVRLTADADRKVRDYSLGMQQRLGIAVALIGNPALLILDEPTNGLDPAGIREIRELLVDLNQKHGKTIFVSSHLLGEMEKMVTHLAVLRQGHLLFQGTIAQLRALQVPQLCLETNHNEQAYRLLLGANYPVQRRADQLMIPVENKPQIDGINRFLIRHDLSVYNLNVQSPTLEDLFFTLTRPAETAE